MLAHGWCRAAVQGVKDPDGVRLVSELADFGFAGPAEAGCLVVGGQVAAGDFAAEYEGHDGAGHVLVYAGEGDRLDIESGFLADLAAEAVGDGLAWFEDSAWWRETGKAPEALKLPNGELRIWRSDLNAWLDRLREGHAA